RRDRLGEQRRLTRPRLPDQPPVTLVTDGERGDVGELALPADQQRGPPVDLPHGRQVRRLRRPGPRRQGCSASGPGTPSRTHQLVGSLTPGPHPGCAGAASSAVSGVTAIAEEPSRGACSVTTPTR